MHPHRIKLYGMEKVAACFFKQMFKVAYKTTEDTSYIYYTDLLSPKVYALALGQESSHDFIVGYYPSEAFRATNIVPPASALRCDVLISCYHTTMTVLDQDIYLGIRPYDNVFPFHYGKLQAEHIPTSINMVTSPFPTTNPIFKFVQPTDDSKLAVFLSHLEKAQVCSELTDNPYTFKALVDREFYVNIDEASLSNIEFQVIDIDDLHPTKGTSNWAEKLSSYFEDKDVTVYLFSDDKPSAMFYLYSEYPTLNTYAISPCKEQTAVYCRALAEINSAANSPEGASGWVDQFTRLVPWSLVTNPNKLYYANCITKSRGL